MRIVVLYHDSNIGGAQKAIDLQSNLLEASGHDVLRVSIHQIKGGRVLWLGRSSIIGSIARVIEEYRSFDADLLITTMFGPGKCALIARLISLGRIEYIYREATNVAMARSILGKIWTFYIIRGSRATMFNSIEQAEILSRVHRNIHYVPNLYERARITRNLNRTIVMVGRCNRVKRFEKGIKKISQISTYRLAIYTTSGDGVYLNELNRLKEELGVSHLVDIKLDITDKDEIYSNEILYLASSFEGSPNVIVEALSRGVPCIAEDISFGVREMLSQEVGCILNEEDNCFASAVNRLRTVSSSSVQESFEKRNLNAVAKKNLLSIV